MKNATLNASIPKAPNLFMRTQTFLCLLACFLTACTQPETRPEGLLAFRTPQLKLAVSEVTLDTQRIHVRKDGIPDGEKKILPQPSDTVFKTWSKRRFLTKADTGKLLICVDELDINERHLKQQWYKGDVSLFSVKLKLTLTHQQPGVPVRTFSFSVRSKLKAPASLTFYERQQLFTRLIERALNALDPSLCQQLTYLT